MFVGLNFGVSRAAKRTRSVGAEGRGGRKHVCAARQIILEDVVFAWCPAGRARGALFVGYRDVERHQPWRRRVDGHRGVHRVERQSLEERSHVAQMSNRNADARRPRRARADARDRNLSGSADRTRPISRSVPSRDFACTTRSIARRSSDRRRCGEARRDRAGQFCAGKPSASLELAYRPPSACGPRADAAKHNEQAREDHRLAIGRTRRSLDARLIHRLLRCVIS